MRDSLQWSRHFESLFHEHSLYSRVHDCPAVILEVMLNTILSLDTEYGREAARVRHNMVSDTVKSLVKMARKTLKSGRRLPVEGCGLLSKLEDAFDDFLRDMGLARIDSLPEDYNAASGTFEDAEAAYRTILNGAIALILADRWNSGDVARTYGLLLGFESIHEIAEMTENEFSSPQHDVDQASGDQEAIHKKPQESLCFGQKFYVYPLHEVFQNLSILKCAYSQWGTEALFHRYFEDLAPCRVSKPEIADWFFVPMLSTCLYAPLWGPHEDRRRSDQEYERQYQRDSKKCLLEEAAFLFADVWQSETERKRWELDVAGLQLRKVAGQEGAESLGDGTIFDGGEDHDQRGVEHNQNAHRNQETRATASINQEDEAREVLLGGLLESHQERTILEDMPDNLDDLGGWEKEGEVATAVNAFVDAATATSSKPIPNDAGQGIRPQRTSRRPLPDDNNKLLADELEAIKKFGRCRHTDLDNMANREIFGPAIRDELFFKSMWYNRRRGADHIFLFADGQGPRLFGNFQMLQNSVFLSVEATCPTWAVRPNLEVEQDVFDCLQTMQKDIVIPGLVTFDRARGLLATNRPSSEREYLVTFHGRHPEHALSHRNAKIRGQVLDTFEKLPGADVSAGFVESYFARKGNSHFCLVPGGSSPWTVHLYESFFAGCIPVILSDEYQVAWRSELPWDEFSIKWPENLLLKDEDFEADLQSIGGDLSPSSSPGLLALYAYLQNLINGGRNVAMKAAVDRYRCFFDYFSTTPACSPWHLVQRKLKKRLIMRRLEMDSPLLQSSTSAGSQHADPLLSIEDSLSMHHIEHKEGAHVVYSDAHSVNDRFWGPTPFEVAFPESIPQEPIHDAFAFAHYDRLSRYHTVDVPANQQRRTFDMLNRTRVKC
ncbi:unnamed protein product [Amoebophrya sp. A25]|nr:unnamed protein product [Amoebophrya sp. A25]|eukprot:GSA25T00002432001.1